MIFIILVLPTCLIFTGNELIHKLTSDGRTYTLRVDLINYANDARYAKYGSFSVGPESDNYTLLLNVYDTSSTLREYFTLYKSNRPIILPLASSCG